MESIYNSVIDRRNSWIIPLVGGMVILSFITVGWYLQSSKPKYPLPPGPKGAPLIGNLRQVPAERSDVQFAKWSKEFSELILVWQSLLAKPKRILC